MEYKFKEIEQKWQQLWDFKVKNPNYYVLSMWPYPSGKLHMGHLRNYLLGDVIARFKTMQGFNVLHPMGWDAFGLPAENAAMENNVSPKNWTLSNIRNMKEELNKIGFSFDWSKEETSCLPEYYKHEQKMFLDFYKQGIAYKKESIVNWDPIDNTVLANEQVIDGKGWRSGAMVEKRLLSQWFLRISEFSSELLEDLKLLENWPEKVKMMQENWIGKSEGAEIQFEVEDSEEKITIFTTKPETLFGASFVAVSYAHPIAKGLKHAENFIKECEMGSTKAEDIETAEKKGFFTGIYAINPVNNKPLPVYIANFVLMEYGTGALFGCPAHDQRDYDFAIKYNLPIKSVCGLAFSTQKYDVYTFKKGEFDIHIKNAEVGEHSHSIPLATVIETPNGFSNIFSSGNENIFHEIKEQLYFYTNKQAGKPSYLDATQGKSDTIFETENFTVRAFKQEDLNNLTLILKELNQNSSWVKLPESEEEVEKSAIKKLALYIKWQQENGFSKWAVFQKNSGEFIGGVGFCYFLPSHEVDTNYKKTDIELGYWFLKKFHEKGYATEIVKGAIKWAEEYSNVLQIVAVTNPENEISEKILTKFSFINTAKQIRDKATGVENFFIKYLKPHSKKPFTGKGIMINSEYLNGLTTQEAREEMFKRFGKKVNFRLKDWGVSRQRYWGCPIPVINCQKCGIVPVPEKDLPIKLPEDVIIKTGENPLKTHPTWRFTHCPSCKNPAERETDTLDTFFESSWYFLRFSGEGGENQAFTNPAEVNDYIGGIEHAILHLLYARFFTKALKKCGYPIPFAEPFKRLITQGMVCHKTFQTLDGKWLTPEEASVMPAHEYTIGASIKMSKSKKNVIEPSAIVKQFGADTARFFIASDNPPERDMEWNDEGVASAHRFLTKFWNFAISLVDVAEITPNTETLKTLHKMLNFYSKEIESIAFNKCIARIRELSNLMFSLNLSQAKHLMPYITAMLMPFAPHIACEIDEILGFKTEKFPEIKQEFLQESTCNISVQVNGKVRAVISIFKGASKEELLKEISLNFAITKHIEGKEIKKEIFIQDKIFNFLL